MSTFPPPGPGGPQPPEEGVEPASAVGGGTHTPSDAMTRYDSEKDAYQRDLQFTRIKALRKEKAASAARIERLTRDQQAARGLRIFFSGVLTIRTLFVDKPG